MTILLASVGFSSSQSAELLVGGLLDERAHRDVAELALGLALELRVAQAHRDDGGEALADVLALRGSSSFSLSRSLARAYLLTTVVSAFLKPSSCMPPSMVLMPLAKEWMPSVVAGVPLERDLDLWSSSALVLEVADLGEQRPPWRR